MTGEERLNGSLGDIEAFARRHGLADLTPAEQALLSRMADRVLTQVATIPRMASKSDEPAPTFRLPPPGRARP